MAKTVLDSRQVVQRSLLNMIASKSGYSGTADNKPADTTEVDNILTAVNSELTPPMLMSESTTPNLTVTVGSATVQNPETSKKRTSTTSPGFTGGSMVFPASSGGTVTVTPGSDPTLTVASGNFIKGLVEIDTSNNIVLTFGTEGASEAAATLPALTATRTPVGYVVIRNVGGTIQNVTNDYIYQFVGPRAVPASGGGGGSGAEAVASGFDPFIKKQFLTPVSSAPSASEFLSEIINRSSIVDLTNDLAVHMGPQRFPFGQLVKKPKESHVPVNSQRGSVVWGLDNDPFQYVRFAGPNWSFQRNSNHGYIVTNSVAGEFIEIVFFGTGLNLLINNYSSQFDVDVSVDGGSPTTFTSVNNNNTYLGKLTQANVILNVAEGLSLGKHTAKIELGQNNQMLFYGYEVVNENTTMTINPGIAYVDGEEVTCAGTTSAYNSSFESGSLGTKGGTAIVYLKADGTIGKAVTPTDASIAYLNSADHSNESLRRRYWWRNFGNGRSDDFTVATISSEAAYALDDNHTIMFSNGGDILYQSTSQDGEVFYLAGNTDEFLFSFIGTGIDLVRSLDNGTGSFNPFDIYIDEVLVADETDFLAADDVAMVQPLASGLKYGSHTLRIVKSGSSNRSITIKYFDVYGPKEPSLPVSTLKLASYDVVGDFVANSTSGYAHISEGTIRRSVIREAELTGSSNDWQYFYDANFLSPGLIAGTSGAAIKYTFEGTGFDARFYCTISTTADVTVEIDGVAYTGSATPYGSGVTWTPGTSTLDLLASTNFIGGFIVEGLSYGIHTVKFTSNAANSFPPVYFDVIQPIFSYNNAKPFAPIWSLPIGNNALADHRKFEPDKQFQAKVNLDIAANWDASSDFNTSNGMNTPQTIASPHLWVYSDGIHPLKIDFTCVDYLNNSGANFIQILVDGKVVPSVGGAALYFNNHTASGLSGPPYSDSRIIELEEGWHNINIGMGIAGAASVGSIYQFLANIKAVQLVS